MCIVFVNLALYMTAYFERRFSTTDKACFADLIKIQLKKTKKTNEELKSGSVSFFQNKF